jgi:DNA-binding transcriptional regulator YiaG
VSHADGARIEELLATLHWSHRTLAGVLEVRRTNVQRWCHGAAEPPPTLLPWLEAIAQGLRDRPLPEGWFEGARDAPAADPL